MIRSLLVTLALLLLASSAAASEFTLQRWLDEPDVKLVAVEFYADWCEPCKKAAPKWEALRKKYASQGLMLVVVDIGEKSDGGRCGKLPWRPDHALCDPALGEALGVKNLPEAFVWSWQGNLLVDRGRHVDEIDGIIRRYLDDNPRVLVEATDLQGAPDPALRRQVEAELGRAGKLTIVPDAEMKERIAKLRKETHEAGRRDDQRCALGEEVSPNSLLRVERFEEMLSLSLVDAVTSCQRATASALWDPERPERMVQKAAFKLMAQLRRTKIQMPGDRAAMAVPVAAPAVEEREFRDQAKDWEMPEAKTAMVTFTSKPDGAVVLVDGKMICQDTSKGCKRLVTPGRREVTMEKEAYLRRTETVLLKGSEKVSWSLDPDFGWLSVTSQPSGLDVTVNGERFGETPIARRRLPPGEYKVTVSNPRHYDAGKVVALDREEHERISVKLDPRLGGVDIVSVDPQGNAIEATVFIDGEEVGKTPYRGKVLIGARKVEVRHDAYGLAKETVEVAEAEVTRRSLTLDRALSQDLKLRDAMAEGRFKAACPAPSDLNIFYYSDVYLPIALWVIAVLAVDNRATGYEWGFFFTKLAGYGVAGASIPLLLTAAPNSTEAKLALAGIIGGAVIGLGSSFIFVPLMKDARVEACYRKKLGMGRSACARPATPAAPGFNLGPLIAPDLSGDTVYGLTGGFQF